MQLTGAAALRPVIAADTSFLQAMFRDARPELAGLPAELIALQQRAQQAQYQAVYPGHADYVIVLGADGSDDPAAVDVGRCWLWRSETEHRLLDLVVSPTYRGRGVGRSVLTTVAAAAAREQLPLRLSVWSANQAAIQLYRSFGFEQYDEQHGYLLLQLMPPMAG